MRIQIDSRFPINMTVSASDFGRLFAAMNSAEQVAVFRSMIDEMEAHPLQWDHIAIELEAPANAEARQKLRDKVAYITGEVAA